MDNVGKGNSLFLSGPPTPASTTASTPRKIFGLNCSLDLDSSDSELDYVGNDKDDIDYVENKNDDGDHFGNVNGDDDDVENDKGDGDENDDDDADTMERSTVSTVVGDEVAFPVSDFVPSTTCSRLSMPAQPQTPKRKLFEIQGEGNLDEDVANAKPRARKSLPAPSSHMVATGTSSDPVCLDDDDEHDKEDKEVNALETPSGTQTPIEKDAILEVGHAVYAPLPGNHGLSFGPYWGLITAKTRRSDGRYLYCIDLNEGDKIGAPGLLSDYIHPLEERIRLEMIGKVKQSFPHQNYLDLWNVTRYGPTPVRWCHSRTALVLCSDYVAHRKWFSSPSMAGLDHLVGPHKSGPAHIVGPGLSYEDLFQLKCGTCYQCVTRPICGSCVGCSFNKRNAQRGRPKQICVQKMCLNIPMQEKCQRCPKILPPHWYFGFNQEWSNSNYRGLWIVTPSLTKKFRSFEAVKKRLPNDFRNIEATSFYRHVGLTSGDARKLSPPPPQQPQPQQASPQTIDAKPPSTTAATVGAVSPTQQECQTGTELRDTYRNAERCNNCSNCQRQPCRLCYTCRTSRPLGCLRRMCNKIYHSRKITLSEHLPKGWSFFFDSLVDLSEMGGALDGLKLVAPNGNQYPSLESAKKANPNDFTPAKKYSTHAFYNFLGINVAARGETQVDSLQCNKMDTSLPRKQSHHDGNILVPSVIEIDCLTSDDEKGPAPSTRRPLKPHALFDQPFFKEWLRVDGTKTFITGKITNIVDEQESGENGHGFTAELEVDHRSKVIESDGWFKDNSSAAMKINHDDAWDGCLRSLHILGQIPGQPLLIHTPRCHERWETPETYQRTMVPAQSIVVQGFHLLPCVEMTYKGFLLQFSVKASSLQTTSFGVFLSIKPLFKSRTSNQPHRFLLAAGTLLDMGVVAPLRYQDIRWAHQHLIKRTIHSSQDQKYQFLNRQKQLYFDISDDMTNNLHSIARRHIPPFVQQIGKGNSMRASVCARFDPEGSLHYLLGHPDVSQGDCVFLANGLEQEIFVDVQEYHEGSIISHVHDRNGRNAVGETLEDTFMKEIQTFTAKEINHFVTSYRPLVSRDPPPTKSVLIRIIAVTIALRHRLEKIQEQSMNVEITMSLNKLTHECEQMTIEGIHAWEMNYTAIDSDLQREAAESNLFRLVFSRIHHQGPIDSLSPTAFRDAICPRPHTFR